MKHLGLISLLLGVTALSTLIVKTPNLSFASELPKFAQDARHPGDDGDKEDSKAKEDSKDGDKGEDDEKPK